MHSKHTKPALRRFWSAPSALFLALSVSFFLSGCGGGGGGGTNGSGLGGVTSGDAAFDSRAAVIKAVSDLFNTLPHATPQDDNNQILALLQSRPEIEAAGQQEPGSVWARFKDNGEVFVVSNDGAVTTADLTTRSRALLQPKPRANGRAATEIPTGQKIYLMNGIGANAALTAPPSGGEQNALLGTAVALHMLSLQQMLSASAGPNYTQVVSQAATVAALKGVTDADVLYLYGHTGMGVTRTGRGLFAVSTAQPTFSVFSPIMITGSDAAAYKNLLPDISAGRVGTMMVVDAQAGDIAPANRKLTMKPYYYITQDFVRQYMTFKPNTSLALINGGNAADNSIAADMMLAFKEKQAAVYSSWDKHPNGWEAIDTGALFVSGIAGGTTTTVPLDPPQRPFSYPRLLFGMKTFQRPGKGYSYAESFGIQGLTTLQAGEMEPGGAKFGMLAPTIQQVDVVTITKDKTEIWISGEFGEAQGQVTVNGGPITVTQWSSTLIKADLPGPTDPHGSGDVVVSVNGHNSNPAPLTLYTLTVRQEDKREYSGRFVVQPNADPTKTVFGDPSGSYTTDATMTLWVRAHVQDTRTNPFETPPFTSRVRQIGLTGSDGGTRSARVESWTVNGTTTLKLSTTATGIFETLTETYTPQSAGPVLLDGTDPRGQVSSIAGTLDPVKKELVLSFFAVINPAVKINIASDQANPNLVPLGVTDITISGPVTIQLSDTGDIIPGSQTFTTGPDAQNGVRTRKLSWSGTVTHKPDPNTPRSAKIRRSGR